MNIYEFNIIPNIIKTYIEENKVLGITITYQELANELRIQKSYLSKIMASNALMSKDQGFLLSKKIGLDLEQKRYLFLLIDRDKAAIKEFRDELIVKIKSIQNLNTRSEDYLNKDLNTITSNQMQMYYLYPEVQLIHLSFSLREFQQNPDRLISLFNISESLYQEIIKILTDLQLISIKSKQVKILKSNLHLPQDSFLFHQWQLQMKLKSLEWIKKLDQPDKYNFTATFTADEEDKEKIRLEYMKFLKKVEGIVKIAKSNKLYQINFDLFKWV